MKRGAKWKGKQKYSLHDLGRVSRSLFLALAIYDSFSPGNIHSEVNQEQVVLSDIHRPWKKDVRLIFLLTS